MMIPGFYTPNTRAGVRPTTTDDDAESRHAGTVADAITGDVSSSGSAGAAVMIGTGSEGMMAQACIAWSRTSPAST
jgi:hypothetical protein